MNRLGAIRMSTSSFIFFLSLGTMMILIGVTLNLNETDEGVEEFEVILTDYPAELVKINNSYGEIETTGESYLYFTSNVSSEPYYEGYVEPEFNIPRNEDWVCYHYSGAFREENPEWGLLIIAEPDDPEFQNQGFIHSVNYKINEKGYLVIHDETLRREYTHSGWIYAFKYFYFVPNPDTFTNRWHELSDNKMEVWYEFSGGVGYEDFCAEADL